MSGVATYRCTTRLCESMGLLPLGLAEGVRVLLLSRSYDGTCGVCGGIPSPLCIPIFLYARLLVHQVVMINSTPCLRLPSMVRAGCSWHSRSLVRVRGSLPLSPAPSIDPQMTCTSSEVLVGEHGLVIGQSSIAYSHPFLCPSIDPQVTCTSSEVLVGEHGLVIGQDLVELVEPGVVHPPGRLRLVPHSTLPISGSGFPAFFG